MAPWLTMFASNKRSRWLCYSFTEKPLNTIQNKLCRATSATRYCSSPWRSSSSHSRCPSAFQRRSIASSIASTKTTRTASTRFRRIMSELRWKASGRLFSSSSWLETFLSRRFIWRQDTQHNDIQHNDSQHNNKKITSLSITTLSIMALNTVVLSFYA